MEFAKRLPFGPDGYDKVILDVDTVGEQTFARTNCRRRPNAFVADLDSPRDDVALQSRVCTAAANGFGRCTNWRSGRVLRSFKSAS